MKTFVFILILITLLAGYKLGYKAARDIAARQSEQTYIEIYLEEHGVN